MPFVGAQVPWRMSRTSAGRRSEAPRSEDWKELAVGKCTRGNGDRSKDYAKHERSQIDCWLTFRNFCISDKADSTSRQLTEGPRPLPNADLTILPAP